MKKLLLLALIPFMGIHVQAQTQQNNLFDIWEQAIKDVNFYDYDAESDPCVMSEALDTSWSFDKYERNKYIKIAQGLTENGFEFAPQNDTLLFLFQYTGYVLGGPTFVYAQSSMKQQAYYVKRYGVLAPAPAADVEAYLEIPILYVGNVDRFRKVINLYGSSVTGGDFSIALRIVFNNGIIASPSYLWSYNAVILPLELQKTQKGRLDQLRDLSTK